MTEALSQNLENSLGSAFDMLSTAAMPTLETEGVAEGEFSNLINTISANIEEAQTNFVGLALNASDNTAVKSNVSSINKFVLNEDSAKNNKTADEVNNLAQIETKLEIKVETPVLNLQQTQEGQQETLEFKAEDLQIPLDKIPTKNNTKIKVEEIEAEDIEIKPILEVLSDNSQVENNVKEDKKEVETFTKEPQKESIENIIISCFDVLNKGEELEKIKTSFEKDFSNFDSIDELDKLDLSIDNIVLHIDETDLTTNEKSKIKEAFLKIKETVKKAKTSLENTLEEQTQVSNEAKKVLDKIVLEVIENENNYNIDTETVQPQKIETAVKEADIISISEQKPLDNKVPSSDIVLDNKTNETQKIEIKESKINETLKQIQPNEATNETTNETIELQKLSEEIKPLLDKFNSFNKKDTETVLKLLNEFEDNTALNKEQKLQVENIIKQISEAPKTKEVVSYTFKDLKTTEIELKTSLNESSTNKVEESLTNKTDEGFLKEVNESLSKKAEKVTSEKTQTAETTKNQDVLNKADKKIKSNILEANLSKIPSASGALSLSDEVAKMAMSKEVPTVLNSTDTPISSHIVYDNGIVKNNTIAIKDVQPLKLDLESHDVLNQITDKFSQLQDTKGHRLTLVLRPNDLGRVSIELKTDSNGLTTNIIAQNSEVRSYIEKNIHTLRQSLVDSGVNVNNIQIKTAGESQSSTYEGNHENQEREQNQQQQEQKQEQNKKEKQETLQSFSNFENQFKKDFSSVLNKTISYNLN